MRPAHLHFLIYKPGYKTHISQVYLPDDPNIDSDVQHGVTRRLLGNYVRHENEKLPAPGVKDPWFSLDYTFIMEPGVAKLPRAADSGQGDDHRDATAGVASDEPSACDGKMNLRANANQQPFPLTGNLCARNRFRAGNRFATCEQSRTIARTEFVF